MCAVLSYLTVFTFHHLQQVSTPNSANLLQRQHVHTCNPPGCRGLFGDVIAVRTAKTFTTRPPKHLHDNFTKERTLNSTMLKACYGSAIACPGCGPLNAGLSLIGGCIAAVTFATEIFLYSDYFRIQILYIFQIMVAVVGFSWNMDADTNRDMR